jgi:hypothetical protein
VTIVRSDEATLEQVLHEVIRRLRPASENRQAAVTVEATGKRGGPE